MKEVMDSIFLSAAKKSDYCRALIPLGHSSVGLPKVEITELHLIGADVDRQDSQQDSLHLSLEPRNTAPQSLARHRAESLNTMEYLTSAIFGILAAVVGGSVAVFRFFPAAEQAINMFRKTVGFGLTISALVTILTLALSKSALRILRSSLEAVAPDRKRKDADEKTSL